MSQQGRLLAALPQCSLSLSDHLSSHCSGHLGDTSPNSSSFFMFCNNELADAPCSFLSVSSKNQKKACGNEAIFPSPAKFFL